MTDHAEMKEGQKTAETTTRPKSFGRKRKMMKNPHKGLSIIVCMPESVREGK